MSLRSDGTYRCDKCGTDVGNASVENAAKIADLDPDDPTRPRNLDLCREPRTGAPRGCAGLVLGPGTLANWTEMRNA